MSQDLFANSRLLSKPVTIQDTKVEVLRRLINRKHGLQLSAYHHVLAMLLTLPKHRGLFGLAQILRD